MSGDEREPLLSNERGGFTVEQDATVEAAVPTVDPHDPAEGAALRVGEEGDGGEDFDAVPSEKRQLGLVSASFLIFNRVIGTGIYSTPSLILRLSGSPGMSLVLWLIGALIASAGTAVYVELGTGLPRSGAEKNYLEFMYRKPKYLAVCIYAFLTTLIGWAAANGVIFGDYIVHAFDLPVTLTNTRSIGVLALTSAFLIHGTNLKLGLRIQNFLGFFMLGVMYFIALAGIFNLLGVPGFKNGDGGKNLQWDNLWKGSRLEANGFVIGLYNVIWSFIGYQNANYALSEVRDPVRTLKRAAPLAIIVITIVYMLVNIAYLAVVPRDELENGGRVVAALFFRNLFGEQTERVVSAVIALSVYGNMLALLFSGGRVVQELARECILPFSEFFASNKPFGTPFAGLFWQWVICIIFAVAPPPGDAFDFILQALTYPISLSSLFVTGGLLFLHSPYAKARAAWAWDPPFKAWTSVTVFFFASNLFLAIVPLFPPAPGMEVFKSIPYWLPVVATFGVAGLGTAYWYLYWIYLPARGGYKLEKVFVLQEDGVSRNVFIKVKG
ncbi:APC amino acid permease [Schizopora paradoxa]|uniref:APC amino acid permease n=1 Tax=Schizopora paradoxa TaxID=27342 RepID=A0A0H2R1Q1_9AGAM|nr:APC amino acid permease [Schizopora paradoxa]